LERIEERTKKAAVADGRGRQGEPEDRSARRASAAPSVDGPAKDRRPSDAVSADATPAFRGAAEIDDNTIIWDADDMEDEAEPPGEMSEDFPDMPVDQGEVIVFEQSSAFETIQGGKRPAGDARRRAPEQTGPSPNEPPGASAATGDGQEPAARPGKAPPTATIEQIKEFFTLGQAAADKQQYLKAIQYFTKVTSLAPNDPRGYYNLAVVSYRLKFYETAREHARRALALGAKPARRILEKIEARQAA
jgi:tetratricopeptide (TPR) repeat protein